MQKSLKNTRPIILLVRMTNRNQCALRLGPCVLASHAPRRDCFVGIACCVYGLSFVLPLLRRAPFGWVCSFDSESLVTGKLLKIFATLFTTWQTRSIRCNRCDQPMCSNCVVCRLGCCHEINGVRIIGIDVPGLVPTHAEAKDILAGAC